MGFRESLCKQVIFVRPGSRKKRKKRRSHV